MKPSLTLFNAVVEKSMKAALSNILPNKRLKILLMSIVNMAFNSPETLIMPSKSSRNLR